MAKHSQELWAGGIIRFAFEDRLLRSVCTSSHFIAVRFGLVESALCQHHNQSRLNIAEWVLSGTYMRMLPAVTLIVHLIIPCITVRPFL